MKLVRGEASTLVSDPTFRRGHDDAWCGMPRLADGLLSQDEVRAYAAGYDFGIWCRDSRGERLRLVRGGVANSEAIAALIRCSLAGALGVPA